mgnify:CR=1 FL=1|tara:strand:+ start:78980 stop:80356 length:1377 start_codon:yes stop_codon:yes gene_type:complete
MEINNLTTKLLVFLLITLSVQNLRSQSQKNPWIVAFGVNTVDFYSVNRDKTTEDDQLLSEFFKVRKNHNYIKAPSMLSVGRYLNSNFNLELAVSFNKITKIRNVNTEGSLSYLAIDTNFNYNINRIIGESTWFDPYAIIGGGANLLQADKAVTFNSGLGAKLWFGEKVGLKAQSVYKHNFKGSYKHFQHSISIVYKFGGYDEDNDGVYDKDDECPNVFGLAEFNGCPDSDEDGIQDSEDACPTIFGVLALKGCPDSDEDGVTDKIDRCPYAKGDPKNYGCPDSDGDGVIDQLDACPNVAGLVENKGCPELDSDGDGIIDKYDQCKFLAGPESNNGCPDIKKELEVELSEIASDILFISGSDRYYLKYENQLNQLVELMKRHNDLNFEIQGHTDNVGSEISNLKLSLKRVNKILNFLVSKGINQFKISVVGLGESTPIYSNDTEEGRAKNRRVEIKILN